MRITARTRSIVVPVFAAMAISAACSGNTSHTSRSQVPEGGEIHSELLVSEADTYSVAVEAVVSASPNAREKAWSYLSTPIADQPLRVRVKITSEAGDVVFTEEAVDPKISSWTAQQLYLEIGRVGLSPGTYRVNARQTGKVLNTNPSFKASIVVVPAYQGK